MSRDDGGPAFPHPAGWRRNPEISDGMTMRDYFAAKALQELIGMSSPDGKDDADITAAWAYVYADAMLKERAK